MFTIFRKIIHLNITNINFQRDINLKTNSSSQFHRLYLLLITCCVVPTYIVAFLIMLICCTGLYENILLPNTDYSKINFRSTLQILEFYYFNMKLDFYMHN